MAYRLIVSVLTLLIAFPVGTEAGGGARVVIDQRSGTVIISENVRISTVAISQGNLVVRITETPQVSHPIPFAEVGETIVVPRTRVRVLERGAKKLIVLPANVTLRELVNRLNTLGVGPRDLIAILQAIKTSGALQADLVVE